MAFRCEKCNVPQPAKTQPIQTVTKQRIRFSDNGLEIAEQLDLCEKCAKKVGEPTIVEADRTMSHFPIN